jgi:hypothetical protein
MLALTGLISAPALAIEPVWTCHMGLKAESLAPSSASLRMAERMTPGSVRPSPANPLSQGSGSVEGTLKLPLYSGDVLEIQTKTSMAYTGKFDSSFRKPIYNAVMQLDARVNEGNFETILVQAMPDSFMYLPGYILLNQDLSVSKVVFGLKNGNGIPNTAEAANKFYLSFFCEETMSTLFLKE